MGHPKGHAPDQASCGGQVGAGAQRTYLDKDTKAGQPICGSRQAPALS
jgi:hypothetical protein